VEKRSLALKGAMANVNGSRLNGKAAIVTGGASGIGQAIAETFAANGASVHILDISADRSAEAAGRITRAGGKACSYECDVTRQKQVEAVLRQVFQRERIDILVNNAGVAHIGKLENTSEHDFDNVFRVNVKGFYNCMFAVVEHMKKQGGGVILNMASVAA